MEALVCIERQLRRSSRDFRRALSDEALQRSRQVRNASKYPASSTVSVIDEPRCRRNGCMPRALDLTPQRPALGPSTQEVALGGGALRCCWVGPARPRPRRGQLKVNLVAPSSSTNASRFEIRNCQASRQVGTTAHSPQQVHRLIDQMLAGRLGMSVPILNRIPNHSPFAGQWDRRRPGFWPRDRERCLAKAPRYNHLQWLIAMRQIARHTSYLARQTLRQAGRVRRSVLDR